VVISPRLLRTGAIVFLLATSLHSAGLIYYSRHSFATGTIAARCKPIANQDAMRVEQVDAGGPADRAGLRIGDDIHAVNERPLVRETDLAQGDTLLVFSDGVVEAFDADDNEFGDDRLIELLRQNASLSADDLIRTVVDAVQRHSGSMPSDGFTLVVGRGRQHREPSDSDRARAGQARSWAAV
jgi:predicted metalloprotease with PDZ domain